VNEIDVQGSHASRKVLHFFLENSRPWKVLENQFGPGKPWKNMLESRAFVLVVQMENKQQ